MNLPALLHELKDVCYGSAQLIPFSEARLQMLAEEVGDIGDSLDFLAKKNDGMWKSPAQARFVQTKIKGDSDLQDRAADAWAHKNGFDGTAFIVAKQLEGYGRTDPLKVRWQVKVYVIDTGGVVAIGKVKVVHPTKTEPQLRYDWNAVDLLFHRTTTPTVTVDIDAEFNAAVAANKPAIDQIKGIPGWETKDILVSFIKQLEQGRVLSAAQQTVVMRMLPDPSSVLGGKAEWPKTVEAFSGLMAKLGKALSGVFAKVDSPYYNAYLAKKKDWNSSVATPNDPKEEAADYASAAEAYASGKFSGTGPEISLLKLIAKASRSEVPGVNTYPEDLYAMAEKAITSKRSAKKDIEAIQFMAHAVARVGSSSISDLQNRFGDAIVAEWDADQHQRFGGLLKSA